MILMTQKIGQGPTQRCDARCYNAIGGKCECICSGRNHGAGVEKALTNTREMFAPFILCEHGRFIGYCEHHCTEPAVKQAPEQVEVTRRAVREIRKQEWARI